MSAEFKTILQFDDSSKQEEIEFFYPNENNTYLNEIREKYQIEQKVESAKCTTEKVVTISKWVNSLWKHHGFNQPKKADALSILEEVEQGKNFRCVEFSIVTSACLNAIGIPTRVVSLRTKDLETREVGAGHVVIECYIDELKKWIMADPQFNVIATNKKHLPINSFELQELITTNEPINFISEPIFNFEPINTKEYINWIYPYLFYAEIPFDVRYELDKPKLTIMGKYKLMLVPKGEKNPTKFQRIIDIDYCLYTNSRSEFYQQPIKSY